MGTVFTQEGKPERGWIARNPKQGSSMNSTENVDSFPNAAGNLVLPGLSKASGSPRGSRNNLRGNGLSARLGTAESLRSVTAFRGIGLMGQSLSGTQCSGVQLSPPKSMLSNLGKFISTQQNVMMELLRSKLAQMWKDED